MRLIAILIAIASAAACRAQSLSDRARIGTVPVTMSCVRRAAGGAKNITWQTDYGSGERETNRTLTYEATVRWSGRAATNALLDVWFVGTPASGGKDIILDEQCLDLVLNPASNCVTRITSEEIAHRKTDYAAIGITEREGARLRGCVIQLIMAGNVIRAYSSLNHLQRIMWDTPFDESLAGKSKKTL